ncbi:MAG TPA: hypothetical protein VNM15_05345 [Candidatus Binatia bacterium]|nr:hypothetical protein [Candidatus Binatia bacterium]
MSRRESVPDPQTALPIVGYEPRPERRGGDHGRAKNIRHGYYSLLHLIKSRRGMLDGRTVLGKMLNEIKGDLERDLGGDLSTAKRMLVHDAAVATLLLRSIENELANVSPTVNGRAGLQSHPIYDLWNKVVSQRRETLKLLGLERAPREIEADPLDLARALAAERAAKPAPAGEPAEAEILK